MPRLSKIGAAALAAFGWTGLSSVTASYLVVAGGGSGGTDHGGGGGAGGFLSGTTSLNPTESYTVTVGAGGASPAYTTAGNNGSNSVFGSITSTGGGCGGGGSHNAGNGGSGGGARPYSPYNVFGTGISGQGNNGGTSSSNETTHREGGGGGGASAVGQDSNLSTGAAGNGGAGSEYPTSSGIYYAGGGGGGCSAGFTTGTGGTGGGGNGASGSSNGSNGTVNKGGGGGGSGGVSASAGGAGGSGIVIISYVGAQQFGGGVVTSSGGNTIHTFTTSGTLSPLNSLTANFLVIAGGGGGGGNLDAFSGGGGAGGYRTSAGTSGGGASAESALTLDTNSIYTVSVGGGGTGGVQSYNGNGTNGTNSSFLSITSVGGGGGGSYTDNGLNGGSGGGAGEDATTAGTGTANQGYAGGNTDGNTITAAGGGGAGAVGASVTSSSTVGGNGGNGVSSSITGSAVTRAGGGGGGGYYGGGTGGSGGGGTGATYSNNPAPTGGSTNTGSGGGGAGGSGTGGNGGSGVVIISYPGSTQQMAGGTVTVAGGNVIHTFTSSGYLAPIFTANNSLRFRQSASARLTRTPSVASNRKTYTISAWVKLGSLDSSSIGTIFCAGDSSTSTSTHLYFYLDQIRFYFGGAGGPEWRTTQVFRDYSAWYHIVAAVDTNQSVLNDKLKLYINGVQVTSWVSQNSIGVIDTQINNTVAHALGSNAATAQYLFDGYMTEFNLIDGQQLTPNSFGTFNSLGSWQPIRYGGSYGTNGFYLPFTGGSSYYGSFNGSNQYLQATLPATLTGAFTVESYFYRSGSGNNYIFTLGDCKTSTGVEYYLASSGTQNQVYSNDAVQISSTSNLPVVSAWNHVAFTRDSSNVTRLFVNGVQVGSTWTTAAAFSSTLRIGVEFYNSAVTGYANGGLSNFRVINGTALYTSNFAPPTSALTAVSGTAILTLQSSTIIDNSGNSLSITNNGTVVTSQAYPFTMLGNQSKDYSPQGNNWTNNNIGVLAGSTLDIMTDVPTLTSATTANYGTLNPLWKGSIQTLSNGNLTSSKSSGTSISDVWGTFGMTSGKWYFECSVSALSATVYIGVGQGGGTGEPTDDLAVSPASYFYGSGDGNKFYGNTGTAYGDTFGAGNIIGCAIDMDNGKIWWSKDGTWQASGDPAAGTNAAFTDLLTRGSNAFLAFSSTNGASNSNTLNWNFGQQPFSYTPPTGFKALNTFNFSTPTVTQSNKHFDVTTFTGNASTNVIANSGFMQPDMVWLKSRTNANNHTIFDSIRGVNNLLYPNLSNDAATGSAQLTAFNSNGFTLGASENSNDSFGELSVGWQWRASNAAGVSNTAGAITSTVSANTTAGFSIVTYTGTGGTGTTTVGHGCQVGGIATAPSMVIIKRRNASANWAVYLTALTSTSYYLILNSSNPQANYGSTFISPSSSTLTIAADSSLLNTSTGTYLAYCFAEVAGYSKFGSYIGNGAGESNGPFIYCGFRPALIIIKVDTGGYNWAMMDIERPGYNSISYRIFADTPNEETTAGDPQLDFLSNGFKLKAGNANYAGTAWYMAFAENPFKYSNAR